MPSVGVRELKQRTSEILRQVREEGVEFEVTHRGRVIARLIPVTPSRPTEAEFADIWTDLDRLAAEIGARWPASMTAAEAVSEERREL